MKHLKSVEQKFELGGLVLGPLWVAYKKGPILLVVLLLALIVVPIVVWGPNFYTLAWAAIFWGINSRSHAGLQAMRLKSMGYERVGDMSASSHAEAETEFRQQNASTANGPASKSPTQAHVAVEHPNWLIANTFGDSKTYIDKTTIVSKGQLVAANVIYVLVPYGTDKRNNKAVKQMRMREEYDLSKGTFRVHSLAFVYDDDTDSAPLAADLEWKAANAGNAKTLEALRSYLQAATRADESPAGSSDEEVNEESAADHEDLILELGLVKAIIQGTSAELVELTSLRTNNVFFLGNPPAFSGLQKWS